MFQNREVAFTIFKISINNKEIVNDMVHLLQPPTPEICLPLPSFARLFYFWVQLETNGGVGQIAWTSWSSADGVSDILRSSFSPVICIYFFSPLH